MVNRNIPELILVLTPEGITVITSTYLLYSHSSTLENYIAKAFVPLYTDTYGLTISPLIEQMLIKADFFPYSSYLYLNFFK